ncbi:MAG: hypothetical protein OEY51_04285 [Cyclobacteriaceae bacterium]|nr:hypothetical protein [Cyclobacteriaceae bacterium]
MADIKKLEKDLTELVNLRNKLNGLDYNHPEYDDIEESLHDKEDDFLESHGEFLEDILHNVHDEYCPDNDVLLPIAYLAKQYIVTGDGQYEVPYNAGVFVDADDYPGKNTRLVLIPNPVRLILNIDKNTRVTVWSSVE